MKLNELEIKLKEEFNNYAVIYKTADNKKASHPKSNSVLKYVVNNALKVVYITTYNHTKVKDLDVGISNFARIRVFDNKSNWLCDVPFIHPLTLSEKTLNASVIDCSEGENDENNTCKVLFLTVKY